MPRRWCRAAPPSACTSWYRCPQARRRRWRCSTGAAAEPGGSVAAVLAALARFFAWWRGELAALVPAAVLARLGFAPEQLLVDVTDSEARFSRISGGREATLGVVTAAQDHRGAVERLLAGVPLADTEVVL